MLKDIENNIAVTIFTDNIRRGLHLREYDDFCKQYPHINISFRHTCGIYHDRYIILDYNSDNERIYHCGASSKDAGNKVTTISEVSDRQVYHTIVDTLIKNPTLILEWCNLRLLHLSFRMFGNGNSNNELSCHHLVFRTSVRPYLLSCKNVEMLIFLSQQTTGNRLYPLF